MKKENLYLIFILFLLISQFLLTKNGFSNSIMDTNRNNVSDTVYEIIKIDSVENIYLIYAERNDSIFKIMSEKTAIKCKSIQVGEKYKMKIVSWFLPEEFHLKMRMAGVKIENEIIVIERDGIVSDLFITKNLKGLCYFSDPVDTEDNSVLFKNKFKYN